MNFELLLLFQHFCELFLELQPAVLPLQIKSNGILRLLKLDRVAVFCLRTVISERNGLSVLNCLNDLHGQPTNSSYGLSRIKSFFAGSHTTPTGSPPFLTDSMESLYKRRNRITPRSVYARCSLLRS